MTMLLKFITNREKGQVYYKWEKGFGIQLQDKIERTQYIDD